MHSWQHPSDRHPLSGRQRIHECARDAQWKWIRKLVEKGVSINVLDKYGYTALHHAVISRDLQTVLMCLPRKSPIGEYTAVDHAARDTRTALHIACSLGLDRIAHAIVDYTHWMVSENIMQEWERDAFLNAVTSDGKTALSYATISGAVQIVNFLCRSPGVNVNLADHVDESTPVHWADKLHDSNSLRLLIASGGDVDRNNRVGQKPLGNLEMLQEFRGSPMHNVERWNAQKFKFELRSTNVDTRYKNTKIFI